MKRVLDILVSIFALVLLAPVILIAAIAISAQDGRTPFYAGYRIGKGGKKFRFVKLRSMRIGADATGVDTTIAGDQRVTRIGRIIRSAKIDEFPGFWHVLAGKMSLVGPRPNLEREVLQYTNLESRLLLVRPGITDLSSIVFSDLSEILSGAEDPNIAYGQLIRPLKSRLGLWYVDNQSIGLDLVILLLTFISLFSRSGAKNSVRRLLRHFGASEELQMIPLSTGNLRPTPPPGSERLVTNEFRDNAIAMSIDFDQKTDT